MLEKGNGERARGLLRYVSSVLDRTALRYRPFWPSNVNASVSPASAAAFQGIQTQRLANALAGRQLQLLRAVKHHLTHVLGSYLRPKGHFQHPPRLVILQLLVAVAAVRGMHQLQAAALRPADGMRDLCDLRRERSSRAGAAAARFDVLSAQAQ